MKNYKKLFSIILVGLFAFIACLGVKAVDQTISLGKAYTLPRYEDNILTFHTKQMKSGEYVYCLNIHAATAENVKAKLTGKGDAGLTYILQNGYPYKHFTGNSKKDYYITQIAVWMYLDETTGSSNTSSKFRSQSDTIMNHAKTLVSNAKKATPQSEDISLEITSPSTNMRLQDNYFVSDAISATTLSGVESYNVTVTGAEGAQIVDMNDNPISNITGNNSFRIKVPSSNVTDETSLVVTATTTKTTFQSYKYAPTNSKMQKVARVVKNTKNAKSVLTFNVSRPSVTINKIDAETKANLAGAIIAIYSSQGLEVRRFTTTTEPYVITDLENGTYTVQEVSAPDGYMKNESSFRFTIDDTNKTHTITIEDYKEVIVPNTDTASTLLFTILGIVVMSSGVLYIRKYGKKAYKK